MEKEMTELEQMRDTLRLFKEELARQRLVNERLMSEVVIKDIEEIVKEC